MPDFVLKLLKLLLGNAWNRAALLLVIGGIAAINGVLQYIVPPFAKAFGVATTIPDTPLWVGFALIALGFLLFILGRLVPDRSLGSLSPEDGRLIRELREIAKQQTMPPDILISFLDQAPRMVFEDPEVRRRFDELLAQARNFDELRKRGPRITGVNPGDEEHMYIGDRFQNQLVRFLNFALHNKPRAALS